MSIEPEPLSPSSRQLERLRWRSRRGLLELDIILTRFLDQHLTQLNATELSQLDEVLRLADNDFLDLVLGRAANNDARIQSMIDKIRIA